MGCLYHGIGAVRAGGQINEIGKAIQAHAESNGFQVVREFVEMGGKVSMAAMRDEIGIDEPEDGEELLVVRSGE